MSIDIPDPDPWAKKAISEQLGLPDSEKLLFRAERLTPSERLKLLQLKVLAGFTIAASYASSDEGTRRIEIEMATIDGEFETNIREARLYENDAQHDSRTGLLNANQVLPYIDTITSVLWRSNNPISKENGLREPLPPSQRQTFGLMIIDIDDFKNYNDRYNLSGGNIVLANLGQRMQLAAEMHMRPSDRQFRYGGDELANLLGVIDLNIPPDIDADELDNYLLHTNYQVPPALINIAHSTHTILTSESVSIRGHLEKVGTSIGFGIFIPPLAPVDADFCIEQVAQMLLEAKKVKGKNQIFTKILPTLRPDSQ